MNILLFFIFFGLGIIIGSFLNVVILRFNTNRTFGGRSACMSCCHTLSWYELIPVFSYLGLKGRCRNCKTKISIQYPIVEFITGIIFAFIFLKFKNLFIFDDFSFSISMSYYATIFSLLLVISVYDLKHKIIPEILVGILIVLAFIGIFLFEDTIFFPHMPKVFELFSGLILAAPFALIWLVSKGKWMGLGDAKLAVGMGYLLGIYGGMSAIMIGSIIGSIVGIFLMIFSNKKYSMKTELPFAPFLVLGTIIVFFMGYNLFFCTKNALCLII